MFMIGQIAMGKIKYFSVIFEFWDEAGSVWWGSQSIWWGIAPPCPCLEPGPFLVVLNKHISHEEHW